MERETTGTTGASVRSGKTPARTLDDIRTDLALVARTLDDIRTDLALVKAVDPGGAISGPEEEDREDISPAVEPKAAISGPEEEDREDISPAVDPEAAISGPEEEDRDISPASTRRPPSAGRGRTIRTHLSRRQLRSRRQRAGGTKTRQTRTAQGTPFPAETG